VLLEAEIFPARSAAFIKKEYVVAEVKLLTVKANKVVEYFLSPFTYMSYLVTPTLSVELSHFRSAVVPVILETFKLPGTEGAMMSNALAVTALLKEELFPARSAAFMLNV